MYAKYKNNPLVEVVGGCKGETLFLSLLLPRAHHQTDSDKQLSFFAPSLFEPLGKNFDCCQRGMCALLLSYYNKLALLRDTRGYHCDYFVYINIVQLYFEETFFLKIQHLEREGNKYLSARNFSFKHLRLNTL